MATNCYACGYRDNEIKSGGAVSDKGKKITLKVEDEEDMSRDMLKVSHCHNTACRMPCADCPSPTLPVLRSLKSILSFSQVPSEGDSPPSKVF